MDLFSTDLPQPGGLGTITIFKKSHPTATGLLLKPCCWREEIGQATELETCSCPVLPCSPRVVWTWLGLLEEEEHQCSELLCAFTWPGYKFLFLIPLLVDVSSFGLNHNR